MHTKDYPWRLYFHEVVQMGPYADRDFAASSQDSKKIDDDPNNSANQKLLTSMDSLLYLAHTTGEHGFVVALPWSSRGVVAHGFPPELTQDRLARGNGDPVFVRLSALLRNAVANKLYPPVKQIAMINPPALVDGVLVPTFAVLMDPVKGYDRPENAKKILEPLGYPSFGF